MKVSVIKELLGIGKLSRTDLILEVNGKTFVKENVVAEVAYQFQRNFHELEFSVVLEYFLGVNWKEDMLKVFVNDCYRYTKNTSHKVPARYFIGRNGVKFKRFQNNMFTQAINQGYIGDDNKSEGNLAELFDKFAKEDADAKANVAIPSN